MGLRMEEFTISDLAQAVVLGLGAMGSLLLVVWQSRCLCRCRIGLGDQCYLFDCSREPPPIQEEDKEKEEEVVPEKKTPEKKTIKKNESWENVTEPLTPSSKRNEPEPEMNQDVP